MKAPVYIAHDVIICGPLEVPSDIYAFMANVMHFT